MNKRFRVCDLNQPFLLAPSLQDWLPEDHLARFVADVMNELDLSAIYAEYERSDGRGLSAYHPLLLARLLLYGYCIGVTSSRRIESATHDNLASRYLAADQHPDHDTLANFRRQHPAVGGIPKVERTRAVLARRGGATAGPSTADGSRRRRTFRQGPTGRSAARRTGRRAKPSASYPAGQG